MTAETAGAEAVGTGGRSTGAAAREVVENGRTYNALWWAKVQSGGPQAVPPETPVVAGMARAVEPDGSAVWLVPTLPDGVGHAVLDELGTPPVPVEQPNETARVLAICVTCCWVERDGPAWPGAVGTLAQIKAVYSGMRGRPEQPSDLTLIIGSLRRLHATHWIRWDEKVGEVRLGPRVVTWGPSQLAELREVCRLLPEPPVAVLTERPVEVPADPLPTDPSSADPSPGDLSPADPSPAARSTEVSDG